MPLAMNQDLLDQQRSWPPAITSNDGGTIGAMAGLGGANTFATSSRTMGVAKLFGLRSPKREPREEALQSYAVEDERHQLRADVSFGPAEIRIRDEQPRPNSQPSQPILKGRITGPVQVIQKIADEWRLSESELAALLSYPGHDSVRDLLAGRLSLRGADREDRVR